MGVRNQKQFTIAAAEDKGTHQGAVRFVEDQREIAAAGLTVREVAKRYRVGPDKVRAWIRRGEMRAVNTATALCGRPRWVIPPEGLRLFERRRTATAPPKPPRRRRPLLIDYYPEI
jgi:excisionase family DNA binding protein